MLNIATSDSVLTTDEFLPSFAIETLGYNQRVDESGKIILNYSKADIGVILMYAGTATIVDGKLIAEIQTTRSVDGSKSSRTLVFHR